MRSRIEPMKKIARSLRQHRELILNYFRAQKLISSGVVEGLNNKAKVTMRKSYGSRTYRVLELALYHSLGKLPEPESTHDFFLTNQNRRRPADREAVSEISTTTLAAPDGAARFFGCYRRVGAIPIRLEGTDRVLPRGRTLPRIGSTRVSFGDALCLCGEKPEVAAKLMERAVKAL
jgi:Transposase